MLMYVSGAQPERSHQHRHIVKQLADLFGGAVRPFMLGRHPDLRCFLDYFLAYRVNSPIEQAHSAAACRSGRRPLSDDDVDLVPGMHGD